MDAQMFVGLPAVHFRTADGSMACGDESPEYSTEDRNEADCPACLKTLLQPQLLLTDEEGWARLFPGTDAGNDEAGSYLQGADLVGEKAFTNAFLVLPSGEVVPAITKDGRTDFDDSDYATAWIKFLPMAAGQSRPDEDLVKKGWTYEVQWSLDGRS